MFKSFLNCLSTCLRDPLHHPENLPTSGIGAKKGNPHTGGWHHQRKWEGAAYFFPPNHKEGSEVRCGRPHLGSLSAVQQWFRRASHKKNLQRNGTQDFQILFQRAKRIVPTKKNGLLADFQVYVPELVNFHVCWSCTSGCRTISSAPTSMTLTVRAPLMSVTQRLFSSPWATFLWLIARLGTRAVKWEANSAMYSHVTYDHTRIVSVPLVHYWPRLEWP